VNRRSFLLLSAAFAAGCATTPGGLSLSNDQREKRINAGPASLYLNDGVYTRYRDVGFFIVRRGANLFAISAICTHRFCKLDAEKDKSFYCPCHGSTFDADGKLTQGPARRDLPVYETSTDAEGNLWVKVGGT
jgi:Rieske Fe-S protein